MEERKRRRSHYPEESAIMSRVITSDYINIYLSIRWQLGAVAFLLLYIISYSGPYPLPLVCALIFSFPHLPPVNLAYVIHLLNHNYTQRINPCLKAFGVAHSTLLQATQSEVAMTVEIRQCTRAKNESSALNHSFSVLQFIRHVAKRISEYP